MEEKSVIASLTSNVFNSTHLLWNTQVKFNKRITRSIGKIQKQGKGQYLIKLSDQLHNTEMRLMNSLVYMMAKVVKKQNTRLKSHLIKWISNTLKC